MIAPTFAPLSERLCWASRAAGLVTLVIGLLVLVGWGLDVELLKSTLPGIGAMNPVSTVAFMLSGLALWGLHRGAERPAVRCGLHLGAALVLAIALMRLAEYTGRVDPDVDLLLYAEKVTGTLPQSRMALNEAVGFLAVGLAIWLLARRGGRALIPAQLLLLATLALAGVAATGYAYHTLSLARLSHYLPMPLNSALAFVVLCLGLFWARPTEGLMAIFAYDTAGGRMARLLVPTCIAVPLLLGLASLQGYLSGFYDEALALALTAILCVGALLGAVTWTAVSLHRLDLTRLELTAALRAQNARLQELDRLKSNFVNAISHDLKTPLTAILGYAELVEDQVAGPLSPEYRGYMGQIERATRRLEGMVNDLLDFARMDAGTFQLRPEQADLGAAVQEVVESLQPLAEEAHVRLGVELPDEPLALTMDAPRIQRVVTNLVGNALKFTPEGGSVHVKAFRQEGALRTEVTDTGVGIAPEDQAKLFQRFSQLQAGKARGGTGLGLSISKALVEAHQGRIGVMSEPGKGSTFWFELPLKGPPTA